MDQIESRLEGIFKSVFRNPNIKISRNMTSSEVAGWDSLGNIHMIIKVQKDFKISLKAGEVVRLRNVGELIDLIATKMQGSV